MPSNSLASVDLLNRGHECQKGWQLFSETSLYRKTASGTCREHPDHDHYGSSDETLGVSLQLVRP